MDFVASDLNGEEITRNFYEEELPKEINKYSEQKKYLKEKVVNCMSNRKDVIVVVRVGLIKKTLLKRPSLSRLEVLEESLMLKLICLIMQQKMI